MPNNQPKKLVSIGSLIRRDGRLTETVERTEPECKCSLRIKLVGDGCAICNPSLRAWPALKTMNKPKPIKAETRGGSCAPAPGSAKYDHDEVRCEEMADLDCDNKMVGEPRTCCVCAGHDCAEARAERLKHPARIAPKPKQETAWAIYSREMLLPFTVRVTRTESLREIERCYGWPWRTCKKRGCSVAKVRVQPVGKAHTV